jgi:hypothetical protein
MRPVSVKELAELLNKAIREGKGDCVVRVSNDEECNGYHELWNKLSVKEGEDIEYYNSETKSFVWYNTILLS